MSRFLLMILLLVSCTNNSPNDLAERGESILKLKWNKAYPDDTMEKSVVGLKWALSFLGATLPAGSPGIELGSDTVTIDLSKLGFDSNAVEKLILLHAGIKASGEYQNTGAIDLGRYVALLIGAPEHYYAIAGVPGTLDELLAPYTLKPEMGYINNSGVSLEHRKIRFSEQENLKQVFLSSEVDSITGNVYEFETVEIMSNGQVRFGIFDANGVRKNNADPSHTNAGKPAKCMWCHESTIQQLYNPQADFLGYLTYPQLQTTLISYNQMLTDQKLALANGVDFSDGQLHTFVELLYISFMEPSAERLSREWGMPVAQVQAVLSGLPTHGHDEFPFLGTCYNRVDVENLAPFQSLMVSSSVREASGVEVNYIN